MSHTPGPWKAEKRGTTAIKYFVVEKTSEEDWGIVINMPEGRAE